MDDSDPDFSVLCSRLLKRVRRKGEFGDEKKEAPKCDELDSHVENTAAAVPPSKRKAPSKRKRQNDGLVQAQVTAGSQPDSRPNGGSQLPTDVVVGSEPEGTGNAAVGEVKEKVLRRMQRFKRISPPRLLLPEKVKHICPSDRPHNETPSHMSPGPLKPPESDEVLALRLQEQLDREARTQVAADAEDGGLFFCQLCHKDLSGMNPGLRAQHTNRCLDKSENTSGVRLPAPAPPPSRPRLPECPICGRGFKSEKSRSVHLKRCSASMGVSPAELLQALHRQAAESLSGSAVVQLQQVGGSRVTGASGLPVKKKAKRKARLMDEDTMVALALSRSLLEQEKERERETEEERQIQAQLSSVPIAGPPPPVLQGRPAAYLPSRGPRRGKRTRHMAPPPPPLLLVQDPQTARRRIQERVSSLLLQPRCPTPPTPTLSPSTLHTHAHSAPLWLHSALPGGGTEFEFYTPELKTFIQPWVGPENKPSVCSEGPPHKQLTDSEPVPAPLPLSQAEAERPPTPALSTPGTQALHDLVELAEEGMTLTQCPDKEDAVAELPLSGFVPETTETIIPSTNTVVSVSVSKLCSDLGTMVNNPQLSDVQLQVDGGEVYFAHSFMLYTRCPLLVNMVHNAGFGVREEDLPHAQRVLLGDVPGEAVYALLQYVYTGCSPLTHTLLPHVLQLAIRFGLSELQQQCEQYSRHPEDLREEAWDACPAQEPPPGPQQSLAETQFLELLRSMWQHEESDCEEFREAGGAAGEAEEEEERDCVDMKEERVDEEELEEIYEFAATQRKTKGTDSDNEEEEDEGGNNRFKEVQHADGERAPSYAAFFKEANTSCHSYRLGEGGDAAAMVTSPSDTCRAEGSRALVRLRCDTRASPERLPDASRNGSFSDLFSQCSGEYMEQTASPAPCCRGNAPAPRRPSSVSEVIDLSVSPPAESSGEMGMSSLPVAGASPALGKGNVVVQSKEGKPALDLQSEGHDTTTRLSPSNSPGSGSSSSRPMSTRSKHSSSEPSVNRAEPLQPDLTSPDLSRNHPELIVLSDSSDDMDIDAAPGEVSPHGGAPVPLSPLRLRQSSVQIRAKGSVEVNHSPKSTDKHTSAHIERRKSDQSEDGPRGMGVQSMLDGSAEVSWLIPATPEPSKRTSSTQTHSSMRPTRLFPKAPSSTSSSLSSAPDVSKTKRCSAHSHSSSPRERATSWKSCLGQRSPRQRSSPDVPERTLDFQKPSSISGPSQASGATLSDASCGESVRLTCPRPHSASEPCSSTPLHPDHPLRPLDPLTSPLLRGCEIRSQAGSDRGGSQSSRGSGDPQLSPSRASLSQTEGPEPREEASRSPLWWKSLYHRDPACTEMDTGTKEKEQGETKDVGECCGNEVVKDTEVNSDLRGSSWALDEPPIAFDDSWGLAGTVGDEARFSLRLESSGDQHTSPEHRGQSRITAPHTSSPPEPRGTNPPSYEAPPNHSLPDPEVWDNWEEAFEDRVVLPLSQRVAELKTPVAPKKKSGAPLQPITPLPGFSDMDTPELKTRLNRYGVRPLPKKQMVLKLKEIHQYTHQLMSSESEEETTASSSMGHPKARLPLPPPAIQPALMAFKKPTVPPPASPRKLQCGDDDQDALPGSQDSNTSSTAESERSNPELYGSDDDDSDGNGITASQAAVRERDQLEAVRSFILSEPLLYRQVLLYQPLSLAALKASLRAAGIRLGTAKLLDFLDSQCITFTTAKPGHSAPSRRRARTREPGRACGRGRKRVAKPVD